MKRLRIVFFAIILASLFFSANPAQAGFLSDTLGFFSKVAEQVQKISIDLSLTFAKKEDFSGSYCIPASACQKIVTRGSVTYCARPLASLCLPPTSTPTPDFGTTTFPITTATTPLPAVTTTTQASTPIVTVIPSITTTTFIPVESTGSGKGGLSCIPKSFCRQSIGAFCVFPIGSLCSEQSITTTTTLPPIAITTTTQAPTTTTTLPPTTTTTTTTTTLPPSCYGAVIEYAQYSSD
ncbi:MAG: hypothetical protein HYT63_02445 [Candidatus Yanofskybacteria bacterium]|nr:hypothetical protein [Candidatus Yanofskybacteria bacterium]